MTLQSVSFQRARQGTVLAASGTGLKVSASSGMTVSIATGTYFLGGKTIVYAGANVTSDTADPTNARYDVVVLDINGTASIVKGTPAASPVVPLYKDDVMPVAILVITAADATIASADIIDVRDLAGISVDGTTISISAAGVLSVIPAGITGFPTVLASGQGNTSIVGNGADQTVFTDSFTAPSTGDMIVVYMKESFTRTAGAGAGNSYTPKIGATNLLSQAFTDGNFRLQEALQSSGTGNRGFFIVKEVQDGATGTAAETVVTNTTNAFNSPPTTVSLLANVPVSTTYNIEYTYCVLKYTGGV